MIIAPSILSADFANLGADVIKCEKAGAEFLHIDVMDGHFVPNISFGAPVIKCVRPLSTAVFDVHLMISQPERYIPDFAKAGADIITVHTEVAADNGELIEQIKSFGVKPCLCVKPATPVEQIFPYLDSLYMVLIMSVEPGFGGQKFMPDMLSKAKELHREIKSRGLDTHIEMDGGIGLQNLKLVIDSGVDVVVAGSSIFGTGDIDAAVKSFLAIK